MHFMAQEEWRQGASRRLSCNGQIIGQPRKIQGKTPWVDSACADCPGFGVLGAAPAPASTFVSEPQIVPLG